MRIGEIPDDWDRRTLISPKHMALTLGTTKGALYNLVSEGRLPHIHVGRKLMFEKQVVLDWLERGGDTVLGKFSCPACQKRREVRKLKLEGRG
jgi:excisionase family DNA binding protein